MENKSEIQYQIDESDLTTFYIYNSQHNPKLKWFRIIFSRALIGFGILLFVMAILGELLFDEGLSFAIILGILGLYSLLFGVFGFKISNKFLLTTLYK